MELPWLARWEPQLLALLRIVTALLFMEHRIMKLFHFPAPQIPGPLPPMLVAAAVIELVTGLLVLFGLWTRLAAFVASGEMAFAYFIGHFPKSVWPAISGGDAAILFCFIFLYVAAAGSGAWSIDAVRLKNAPVR